MKKLTSVVALITTLILTLPVAASAHVIVTPDQVDIGQELVFHISVPNERTSPVTSLKLAVPKGVDEVTPTVTPGWTITTDGNGDTITAITWTGNIPVGQREDFSFGAQAPANATQLDWKAYQTYADGTVVHWDQKPNGNDDATGKAGPYSVTKVVDDLSSPPADSTSSKDTLALVLSVAALSLSVGSLFIRRK